MGAVVAALVGMLIVAIAMDARKLPLGRVKYVPWTMLTLLLIVAVAFSGKVLLQDVIRR